MARSVKKDIAYDLTFVTREVGKLGNGRRRWHGPERLRRYRQCGRGPARRTDRRRRGRPDDADADPAVLGEAGGLDLQRPGGGGRDAAGRGRRAPAQGYGEPALGGADDARLGTDGVPRRVPAEAARRLAGQPEERGNPARRGVAGRGGGHGAPVRARPQVRAADGPSAARTCGRARTGAPWPPPR